MPFDLHFLRRHSRRFVLLAICLLALRLSGISGISFPALADFHAGNEGEAIVICTAAGMATLEADAPDAPAQPHFPMGAHCPLCLIGHDALPAPSFADFSLPGPGSRTFFPPASASFQPSAPDKRHAPSRAPPSFA
jgi:hypothetical protein